MRLLLTCSLLCFALTCFAQDQTYYFKKDGSKVDLKDSADYIRFVRAPEPGATVYKVTEYYRTGKLKLTGESTSDYPINFQGEKITYFASGVKSSTSNYNNGRLVGFIHEFFPSGKPYLVKDPAKAILSDDEIMANYDSLGNQLVANGNGYCKLYDDNFSTLTAEGAVKEGKRDGIWLFTDKNETRVETYVEGKFIEGALTTAEGLTIKYTQREIAPEFKGGVNGFTKFLGKTIKYPKFERQNNIQGKVFVSFVIEKDGTLTDIKAFRAPTEGLATEAIRIFKLSPTWSPGIQYGRPVRVQYTVPITFTLGGGLF